MSANKFVYSQKIKETKLIWIICESKYSFCLHIILPKGIAIVLAMSCVDGNINSRKLFLWAGIESVG